MKANLSHKIQLYPNNKQKTYFKKAAGCRRLAYNWTLATVRALYEEGIKTGKYDLSKRFNAIKDEEYHFVLEVTKWAVQKGIYDAWNALERGWNKVSKPPKFKKKGKCRDSFYLGVNDFKVEGKSLKIPRLDTWIKMSQNIRFPGKILSVTIGKDNEKWYASFSIEVDLDTWSYPHTCENQEVCGIDLGLKSLMVVSDGTVVENKKYFRKNERKLKKLQRSLSRKKKGSKNRKKAKCLLSRFHEKIRNSRRDWQHKCTSLLVKFNRFIGIEDLNVSGMMKNHNLAKSISDVGWYEIRRQLEYKAKLSGSHLVIAGRFFPSTKMCSNCFEINDNLTLEDRDLVCTSCGTHHDRDLNASQNLENLARRYRESINACGEDVRLETPSEIKQPRRSKKRASKTLLNTENLV